MITQKTNDQDHEKKPTLIIQKNAVKKQDPTSR